MEEEQQQKCYIRNFKYSDGTVLTFHTICDNWELPKDSDGYGRHLAPDGAELVEVKDEVHRV